MGGTVSFVAYAELFDGVIIVTEGGGNSNAIGEGGAQTIKIVGFDLEVDGLDGARVVEGVGGECNVRERQTQSESREMSFLSASMVKV